MACSASTRHSWRFTHCEGTERNRLDKILIQWYVQYYILGIVWVIIILQCSNCWGLVLFGHSDQSEAVSTHIHTVATYSVPCKLYTSLVHTTMPAPRCLCEFLSVTYLCSLSVRSKAWWGLGTHLGAQGPVSLNLLVSGKPPNLIPFSLLSLHAHGIATSFTLTLMYSSICKKSRESNRRYEWVTIKTKKPEYRHVLTHGPSQQIPNIHNTKAHAHTPECSMCRDTQNIHHVNLCPALCLLRPFCLG